MTIEEMRAELEAATAKQNELAKRLAEEEAKEAEIKQQQYIAEKDRRTKELYELLEMVETKLESYIADYGSFRYHAHDDDGFLPTYIWHNFLF